jgi:hypothetical protein
MDKKTTIIRSPHQQLTKQAERLFALWLPLAILVSLLPVTGPANAQLSASDLSLILLDSTTPYATAIRQLETAGAHIQHVFPPNVLIGQLSPTLTPGELASSGVTAVYREAVNPDELAAYGPPAQRAGRAWNALLAALTPQSAASQITVALAGADLVGDALLPPDLPAGSQTMLASVAGDEPGYYQTSEFMIGRVAVGIILPESNGSVDPSTEDWTEQEKERVYGEIVAATNWWATQEPAARLTFVYDDHSSQPVPVSYEPISRPQNDQELWIGEAMGRLGYDGTTSYFARVRDYVNNLRATYQTDWAFAIFVIDSSNDADNYFAAGYFAYAYLGGPFMVMTYGNNGYGINNMDAVAAHEMGHIFLALDQYIGAHVPCTTTAGYLAVETQNSLYGACASNEPSIMRGQVWPYANGAIDRYARGQIGWWDGDGDGVLDPVDTSTDIILAQETRPEARQTIRYAGSARDIPVPSTQRCPTTINRITGLTYRLDDGDWQPASPADGAFDSFQETFTFALPPLPEGIYQLDLLVHTSLDGDRFFNAVDMVVVPSPDSSAPLQRLQDLPSNPTADDTPTYTGVAAAVNGTIANVEFRVDGGNWQPTEAADGRFDQPVEAFSFTTSTLSPGIHTIQVRTTDAGGEIAYPCSSDTLQVLELHTSYLPVVMCDQ